MTTFPWQEVEGVPSNRLSALALYSPSFSHRREAMLIGVSLASVSLVLFADTLLPEDYLLWAGFVAISAVALSVSHFMQPVTVRKVHIPNPHLENVLGAAAWLLVSYESSRRVRRGERREMWEMYHELIDVVDTPRSPETAATLDAEMLLKLDLLAWQMQAYSDKAQAGRVR